VKDSSNAAFEKICLIQVSVDRNLIYIIDFKVYSMAVQKLTEQLNQPSIPWKVLKRILDNKSIHNLEDDDKSILWRTLLCLRHRRRYLLFLV